MPFLAWSLQAMFFKVEGLLLLQLAPTAYLSPQLLYLPYTVVLLGDSGGIGTKEEISVLQQPQPAATMLGSLFVPYYFSLITATESQLDQDHVIRLVYVLYFYTHLYLIDIHRDAKT